MISLPQHSLSWRKSSRSNGSDACVEVVCLNDHVWRKSSRSNGTSACVEVAPTSSAIAIRDSKHCAGHDYPTLSVAPSGWTSFLTDVRTGRLDGR